MTEIVFHVTVRGSLKPHHDARQATSVMDATASNAPHAAGSLAYRSISSLASSTPAAYFAVPGQTTFFDDLPRDVKIEILGSAELTLLDLARLEGES